MRWYRHIATTAAVAGLAATSTACSASHSGANAKLVVPKVTTTMPTTPRTTRTFNFTLAKARAMAFFIPVGFVAVRTIKGPMPGHVNGPIPGTTNDAQYFVNAALGQSFVVSVYRGGPLLLQPWMHPSVRGGPGYATYVGSDPVTGQREFTWAVNSKTSAFVGGTHMTDDALLRIANGMVVAP